MIFLISRQLRSTITEFTEWFLINYTNVHMLNQIPRGRIHFVVSVICTMYMLPRIGGHDMKLALNRSKVKENLIVSKGVCYQAFLNLHYLYI